MTPYEGLPTRAFWRSGVANASPDGPRQLADVAFKIAKTDRVATAGSCFAQHIARRLRQNGFNYVDVEEAPDWLPKEDHAAFGFGLFSARFGNVYTSTQLLQLLQRSTRDFTPRERFWTKGGRYYDPFRPSIEPGGFASEEEVIDSQNSHLRAVRRMLRRTDVFVFTMGLTETWASKADGAVYPVCPGVQAGEFDADKYEFINLSYDEVVSDMRRAIKLMLGINPQMRFILTVSPVPLTATASGSHVLVATTYSKSVLRAAAGQLAREFDQLMYFPSYEIITTPPIGERYFEDNMRSVKAAGVDVVMKTFMSECCQTDEVVDAPPVVAKPQPAKKRAKRDSLVCDDLALETYAP